MHAGNGVDARNGNLTLHHHARELFSYCVSVVLSSVVRGEAQNEIFGEINLLGVRRVIVKNGNCYFGIVQRAIFE